MSDLKDKKIYVAGHRGLVGSAIVRALRKSGCERLILRTHSELDLTQSAEVNEFFATERPDVVVLAAAKVGGIAANNSQRADFIYENLAIAANVISAAHKFGAKKLLNLGSSCIYPREAAQPIAESALLSGELEYTNEPYAVAKIAALKLCEAYSLQYGCNFLSAMPTNLYGPGDNFDLESSHVLPALLRKIHLAKLLSIGDFAAVCANLGADEAQARALCERYGISAQSVQVWGSGRPLREFLHADDLARACVHVLESVNFNDLCGDLSGGKEIKNTHINIGSQEEISIADLAALIAKIVGFSGQICFDASRPDGTMRKLMNSSKIRALGWRPQISLESGIASVYEHYCQHLAKEKA